MPSSASRQPRSVLLLAVLFLGFVVTGVVTTILSPLLPLLISRWALTDSQAGLFFSASFLGSLFGVIASSSLQTRFGFAVPHIAGYVFMSLGIAGLTSQSHYLAIVATLIFGGGFGMVIPATNLCVAEMFDSRRVAALNLLNLTWGVGALCSPPLILLSQHSARPSLVLYMIASCAALLALASAFAPFPKFLQTSVRSSEPIPTSHPLHVPIALAALFFLYIGTEASISGWSAEQADRIAGFTAKFASLTPMYFWAGLMSGRALATFFVHRFAEFRIVILALLLAAIGTLALLAAPQQSALSFGVFLAGLGLSSLYPIFIAWLAKWYGPRAGRVGGIMFSVAALGGSVMPWLVGLISQRSSNLRIGLLVPLAGCLLMLAIVAAARRRIVA